MQADLVEMEKRATKGDANAAYLAGRMYETGVGAPYNRPDMRKALSFYDRAQSEGSVNARFRVPLLRTHGISLPNYGGPSAGGKINPPEDTTGGAAVMQDAVRSGYSPATDALVATDNAAAPASSADDGMALALLLVGALVVPAAASSGSTASAADSSSYSGPSIDPVYSKVCTIYYDEQVYTPPNEPFIRTERRSRTGYGYECP